VERKAHWENSILSEKEASILLDTGEREAKDWEKDVLNRLKERIVIPSRTRRGIYCEPRKGERD